MIGNGRSLFAILAAISLALTGCLSSGDDGDDLEKFPEFSSIADDGETYSQSDFTGSPFIVLFSAEWCDTPCHSTMHAINSTLDGPKMIVMSTDPQDKPQEISLQDWHEKADGYDDEADDIGQTLEFPFMKGIEAAEDLEVSARPTVVFVNDAGEVVKLHKGGLTDETEIRDFWLAAGGSV